MCDFSQYGGASDEWLAVAATLPPPPKFSSIIDRRNATNKQREEVSAEAMKSVADKLVMRDWTIPTRDGSTVGARSYRSKAIPGDAVLPVYFYVHGGGFLYGTLNTEDASCARIAISNDVVVVHVNYRHTPEFPYPTSWNDVEDGFLWMHAHMGELGGDPEKVVVGGASAGGLLSASLTLAQHLGKVGQDVPRIAGEVLIIPCMAQPFCYEPQLKKMKDPSVSSYKENENAPVLPRAMMETFSGLLKVENPDVNDLRLNPGNATPDQVKGLPPTTLGIAGLDPLRDEGLLYAKMLSEAGVPTDTHIFKGVPHGFRRCGDKLTESKHWDDVIDNGIKFALSKPAATGKFVIRESYD